MVRRFAPCSINSIYLFENADPLLKRCVHIARSNLFLKLNYMVFSSEKYMKIISHWCLADDTLLTNQQAGMRDENAVPVVMANDLGHLFTSSFSAENVWAFLVVFAACTWTITTIFIAILGKNSIQKNDLKSSTELCLKALGQRQLTFSWTFFSC